jgi:patatin-like phospholipase/acyl hydrolase
MKILALSGGGTSGYRTAQFLHLLEQYTNTPCWTMFDMVVGLSAGSINAGMIAKKTPAKYVADQFRIFCPKMFGNPRNIFSRLFWKSQFDNAELIRLTRENMDFDVSESAVKTMIYALAISGTDTIKPKHWKSWTDSGVKMYDIVMASSSAPSMFPPYDITINNQTITYTDGGLISNNPSMAALTEAIKLKTDIKDIHIINVGNGSMPSIQHGKFTSLFDVATKLGNVCIPAAEASTEYQCNQIIGNNLLVVRPPKYIPSTKLAFDEMDEQAKMMWDLYKPAVMDVLAK